MWKKTLTFFIVIMIVLSTIPLSVAAKPGDVAGVYYATDIKTYLNGTEISAINIGGETLISAEDMAHFGFFVWWDGIERTLRIQENTGTVAGSVEPIPNNTIPAGTAIGNYYETDIITYLENIPIIAYNIGGRTYIHAEEMRNYGYLVEWSAEKWTLEISSPRPAGLVYDILLSTGENKGWGVGSPGEECVGAFSIKYTKADVGYTDDADYFDLTMRSTGHGYQFDMVFYQNKALFNSESLLNKLRPLCYDGYGVETPCDKSEKYDIVNQAIDIYINGQRAEKISVISGAGNGHRDFYFHVEDLPQYSINEIEEIVVSFGYSPGDLRLFFGPTYQN